MAQVRFVQQDDSETIVGCATCHVYVEPSQATFLPPPSAQEAEMLSNVYARKPNSRLCCQIKVPRAIAQLVVFIPEAQS